MKILFLHGAIKNAGDFLIAHRSKLLIKNIIPECELISLWEGEESEKVNEVIQISNGIVFCGGPFFTTNIYPQDIPLIPSLRDIKVPMINIGGGWFGSDSRTKTIVDYSINDSSMELLKKIIESSSELSCRDWHTTNMLRAKGLMANMHGCPAWYDLSYIDTNKLRNKNEIQRICISDPADVKNSEAAAMVVSWLRERYSYAEIIYVFHRGSWGKDEGSYGERRRKGIEDVLKKNGVKWIDISGGYTGFEIYDTCDLHIGFRVHAHIYNLSHRNRSILIEEDGRGSGVNQALGLNSIHVYDETRQYKQEIIRKIGNRISPKINKYLIEDLENEIFRMECTDGIEYEQAFSRMQYYYKKMCKHILKIKKW